MAFLDEVGLAEVWDRTKDLINAHVWRKQRKSVSMGDEHRVYYELDANELYYGDTVTEANGKVTINNPVTLGTTAYDGKQSQLSALLAGKYIQFPDELAYSAVTDANVSGSTVFYLYSVENNEEQADGFSDNFSRFTVSEVSCTFTDVGFVCDTDRYAYPPAEDDGFAYTYLGVWGLASLYAKSESEAKSLLNTLLGG